MHWNIFYRLSVARRPFVAPKIQKTKKPTIDRMNLNNLQKAICSAIRVRKFIRDKPKVSDSISSSTPVGTTDLCNNNDSPVSFVWIAAATGACHYRWLFLFPCAVSTSFVPKHWSHSSLRMQCVYITLLRTGEKQIYTICVHAVDI